MSSKDRERRYLDCLFHARPELRSGNVQSTEAPDFLMDAPSGTIGIEITEYVELPVVGRPHAMEQSGLREVVVTLARSSYEGSGGPPLHVNVSFAQHPPLTKRRARELAMELAEFLAHSRSQLISYTQSRFLDDVTTELFPEIIGISAIQVPDISYSGWVTGDAGWVWHAGEYEVTRIVRAKEPKLLAYRTRCTSAWLLIAFDLYASGDAIPAPKDPPDFELETGFDKVFCLTVVTGNAVEINCHKPV